MIEVSLEIPCPAELDIAAAVSAAAEAAIAKEGRAGAWLSAAVVDDAAIQALNRAFRQMDRPTDVLSFPMEEGADIAGPPDGFLGDLVISLPRAEAQAVEYGHTLLREISFLTIHGALHLLGYDHEQEEQARRMFARQEEILKEMGVLR